MVRKEGRKEVRLVNREEWQERKDGEMVRKEERVVKKKG